MSKLRAVSSVVEILRQAWCDGRPIVPFLASGISAHTGFPLLTELSDYLLKTKFYIKRGVFRAALDHPHISPSTPDDLQNHPARYLRDYHWPNFNQLDLELNHFSRLDRKRPELVIPWNSKIINTYLKQEECISAYEEAMKKDKWGRDRWRLPTACQHILLEDIYYRDKKLALAIQRAVWEMTWKPRADWSQLLLDLSEGDLGLVDALLAHLGGRYSPGTAHVLLAHLVKVLRIRLLLTINFDPYIEQALADEGAPHRIFDVGRDQTPPAATVVKEAPLAVVKLHGSAYSLRFGERLDYQLDDATRSNVESYVPDDALLIVLGFSGQERRMMQLIESLVFRSAERSRAARHPKLIWMHYEPQAELAPAVKSLQARLEGVQQSHLMVTERLDDAGGFLLDAYQRLTNTIPKCKTRISILAKRIVPRHVQEQPSSDELPSEPFQLFVRDSLIAGNRATTTSDRPRWFVFEDVALSPSVRLSNFVRTLQDKQYRVIWLDLEEHHTPSGVITELIDKLRVFDPDLPPLVLPLEPPDDGQDEAQAGEREQSLSAKRFEKVIRYLRRALNRGKYVLAFDSLESFARRHTFHHGLPVVRKSPDGQRDGTKRELQRVDDLMTFLKFLTALNPGESSEVGAEIEDFRTLDWYCCLACDEPMPRHIEDDESELNLWQTIRSRICDFIRNFMTETKQDPSTRKHFYHPPALPQPDPPASDPSPKSELDLVALLEKLDLQDVVKSSQSLQGGLDGLVDRALNYIDANRTAYSDQGRAAREKTIDPDVALLMLSMFRRPWSFVAAQTILAEYLPPRSEMLLDRKNLTIKKCLDELRNSREQVLVPLESGTYWIPRQVREWTYKLLADPVRLSRLLEELETKATGRFPQHTKRLIFLIMVHSRVARFYYLNLFQRSHDPNTLFECFYHQISALRYAKTLQAYCEVNPGGFKDDPKHLELIRIHEGIEITAAEPKALVLALRKKLLQVLFNIFVREDETVRSASSADTWLAWLDQMQKDLDEIVVVKDEIHDREVVWWWSDQESDERKNDIPSGKDRRQELRDLRHQMEFHFSYVRARLLRETRFFDQCIKKCIRTLNHICLGTFAEALVRNRNSKRRGRRSFDTIAKDRVDRIFEPFEASIYDVSSIDAVWERAKQGFQDFMTIIRAKALADETTAGDGTQPMDDDGFADALSLLAQRPSDWRVMPAAIKALLNIAACLRRGEPKPARKLVRCVNHKIEKLFGISRKIIERRGGSIAGLGRPSAAKSREIPRGKKPKHDDFPEEVRLDLIKLRRDYDINACRYRAELFDPWQQGPVDALGEKRSDYEVQKTKARRHVGRAVALRNQIRGSEFRSPTDLASCLCKLLLAEAQGLMWLRRYDDAAQCLDAASNGLDESQSRHRSLSAAVHRARADVFMLIADKALLCKERAQVSRHIKGAKAKLQEADEELRAAEKLLRTGRRGAGQWRRLYETTAQLQIEKLLLILAEIEFENTSHRDALSFVAEVHGLLQRGLEAVRGGIDCSLSPLSLLQVAKSSPTDPYRESVVRRDLYPWYMRWLQLMTTGYFALINFSDTHSQEMAAAAVKKSPTQKLERAKRFVDTVDKINKNRTSLIDLEGYINRWKALNHSAALNRFFKERAEPIWVKVLEDCKELGKLTVPEMIQRLGKQPGKFCPTLRQAVLTFCDTKFDLGDSSGGRIAKNLYDALFLEEIDLRKSRI